MEKVKENNFPLKAFISASAVGYYGAVTSNSIFNETSPPSNDFLGETCRLWEQAADKFNEIGIRTVKIRTGIVLTKDDGALAKMTNTFKMGIGLSLGNGNQYLPWIHVEDLCNIYIKAIEDDKMNGAYNAVSPDHKTYNEFSAILSEIFKTPFGFVNLPTFALKILFGKMSEMLLEGSRVSSEKIREAGFVFLFPELENALYNLIKRHNDNRGK